MTENTVLHRKVQNSARHLASECHRAMSVFHQALADHDILRRGLIGLSHIDLAALYRDAVISQRKTHPENLNVPAGLRIAAVRVGRICGILDIQSDEMQIVAEIGMQRPCRRVAAGHSLQGDVSAMIDKEQPRAECLLIALWILPPVLA